MTPLLSVQGLHAGYGEVPVLHDVNLHVNAGEIVAIVGANGAGKSTLLSAIAGLLRPTAGRVMFGDGDITGRPAHRGPASGLALVPEGGRLFPFLTVEDNLLLGSYAGCPKNERAARMDEVMEIFPILRERSAQLAGKLSGGERQMCAVARAMMCHPTMMMLDEPSVGLSPLMVERILAVVQQLVARHDLTVLLVEQNVVEALDLADRAYVLDHGAMVLDGPAAQLAADEQVRQTFMGL
jgi:branched-chain amino acid transport system ATP-binding protein